MVVAHDRQQRVARGQAAEDARAGLGVLAHERPLVLVERVGLEQQLDGQRELADVVDERAELDRGGGVGVGPELQRDVARVEGDRGRVLGGLGIEGRERAHEGDAGREGGAVDGARRAAAAPWGTEESAHACGHGGAAQGANGSRASPPTPSTTCLSSTPAKRPTAGASTGRRVVQLSG